MNASTSLPADDADLMALLGGIALALDPPPANSYDIGYGLFSLYRMEDELAALVADSLTSAGAVRASTTDVRMLSFESSELTVEVQSSRIGDRIAILGQVFETEPSQSAPTESVVRVVYLETQDGIQASVVVDAGGRFEFDDVPAGLVRFRVASDETSGVATAWTQL
jgi:hypothetical protein